MTDRYHDAQAAAELHLEHCWAHLNEDAPEPDTLAPFCGCLTCEVRETLHAAEPHLLAAALESAADELEARLAKFPMAGRNTRAWWAVAVLRDLAKEQDQEDDA
jgi:hypothetical protein